MTMLDNACAQAVSTALCVAPVTQSTHVQTPYYYYDSLYDNYLMSAGLSPAAVPPFTSAEATYAIELGTTIEQTACAAGLSAFFFPSCCMHTVGTAPIMFTLAIANVTLYQSLSDWWSGTNQYSHKLMDPAGCYCTRGYVCNPTCDQSQCGSDLPGFNSTCRPPTNGNDCLQASPTPAASSAHNILSSARNLSLVALLSCLIAVCFSY